MEVNQQALRSKLLELENKLFNRALMCLSRREHSTKELHEKLELFLKKSIDNALGDADRTDDMHVLIDRVLARVTALGYLDDKRFTQMYIRSRTARGYGPVRIRAELARKGINTGLMGGTFTDENNEPIQRIVEGISRKLKWSNINEPKVQAQITRHYAMKGFSFDTIRAAIEIAKRTN